MLAIVCPDGFPYPELQTISSISLSQYGLPFLYIIFKKFVKKAGYNATYNIKKDEFIGKKRNIIKKIVIVILFSPK